jgi:hypothetical protein
VVLRRQGKEKEGTWIKLLLLLLFSFCIFVWQRFSDVCWLLLLICVGTEALHKALELDRLYYKNDYFRVKEPIQHGV